MSNICFGVQSNQLQINWKEKTRLATHWKRTGGEEVGGVVVERKHDFFSLLGRPSLACFLGEWGWSTGAERSRLKSKPRFPPSKPSPLLLRMQLKITPRLGIGKNAVFRGKWVWESDGRGQKSPPPLNTSFSAKRSSRTERCLNA